jgi:hypothetical protein
VQVDGGEGREALLDDDADDLLADPVAHLRDGLVVAGHERDRHPEVAGEGGVDAVLAGGAAVRRTSFT